MNDTEKVAVCIARHQRATFAEIYEETRVESKKLYDILNVLEAIGLIERYSKHYKTTFQFQYDERIYNPLFWDFPLIVEEKQVQILRLLDRLQNY